MPPRTKPGRDPSTNSLSYQYLLRILPEARKIAEYSQTVHNKHKVVKILLQ